MGSGLDVLSSKLTAGAWAWQAPPLGRISQSPMTERFFAPCRRIGVGLLMALDPLPRGSPGVDFTFDCDHF
jgi:hypothetical protein